MTVVVAPITLRLGEGVVPPAVFQLDLVKPAPVLLVVGVMHLQRVGVPQESLLLCNHEFAFLENRVRVVAIPVFVLRATRPDAPSP